MIYTGYYARSSFYEEQGLTLISISGKCPQGFKGLHWKFLAPTWNIFSNWKKGYISDDVYTQQFFEQILSKINIPLFKEKLQQVQNPILLCYEKQGFCHRHLVKDWLNSIGIACEEF